MHSSISNVVRRFLARDVLSDDRFRPPKSVVNAVDEGKLDPHVLLYWKSVVETISQSPSGWKGSASYGAAVAYWRNKCAKNSFPLPKEYLEGLGGEGSAGPWRIKSGDEIEDWVRQTLLSQGLIATLEKTVAEWNMEIVHLTRELEESQARIEKHQAGLAAAKTDKGIAQKTKWLQEAQKDALKFGKDLLVAQQELTKLVDTALKKSKAESYAIEFEKEFQFLMLVAQKDLDKKAVLESVRKALERFEAGLAIPDAESPAHDIARYEGPSGKTAGLMDFISGALQKAWDYLRGAFEYFTDWVSGLVGTTRKIDQLLSQAGA